MLYDDRDVRAGQKFADADLLGIPQRVVMSEKTISADKYELKSRQSSESQQVDLDELLNALGVHS